MSDNNAIDIKRKLMILTDGREFYDNKEGKDNSEKRRK